MGIMIGGDKMRMRRNKYGNKKTRVDGIVFDSQAEAGLYLELKARQKIGEIVTIDCHVPFKLWGFDLMTRKAISVCTHEVDFLCLMPDGIQEAHEYKGAETALWRLKKKLFEASYQEIPYIVHKAGGTRLTKKRKSKIGSTG